MENCDSDAHHHPYGDWYEPGRGELYVAKGLFALTRYTSHDVLHCALKCYTLKTTGNRQQATDATLRADALLCAKATGYE